MLRQVLILAAAQALFQTTSVLVVTIGGLAGAVIAASPELATLPIAAMFLGTAFVTYPAAMWMARVGRRRGFLLGALLGTAGGLVAALGVWLEMLSLLAAGTFLVGAHQAFAQFYRFAASEIASEAFRPRAISLVLGGGIVAAFGGPMLARLGGPMLAPEYVGSFLLLAAASAVCAAVLLGLNVPVQKTADEAKVAGRPWFVIATQPAYLVALFGALTGYGVMILAMTATPIAMLHHHHDLASASHVIQFHVLGMFLPSFFTGSLITRFGVLNVMLAGIALLGAHVLTTLSGTGFVSFAGALTLLGIGWNFLFIGGTTLLTTTYSAKEKGRAQATNDITIFVVGVACSLCAAMLLRAVGWQMLNVLLLPWLAFAAASVFWLGHRQRLGRASAFAK